MTNLTNVLKIENGYLQKVLKDSHLQSFYKEMIANR